MWSGLGVNCSQPSAFWHNYTAAIGEPYIPHVVDNFSRVRMFVDLSMSSSRTAIRTWALQLKAAKPDIKILYGVSRAGLSSTNRGAHTALVLAEAQWAMDNGIDAFQISNELENSKDASLTDAQVRTYVRSLATQVKQVFTREISYALSQTKEDGWIAEGKGDLDKLSINLYGSFAAFESDARRFYAAFGADCFVSEWNVNTVWANSSVDGRGPTSSDFDEVYGRELVKRLNILRAIGFSEAYFFTLWSFSESFGVDNFALYTRDEGPKPAMNQLLNKRTSYVVKG